LQTGRIICLGFLLAGAAGCGSKTYQVGGKVSFSDGTPVDAGWVVFAPVDSQATVGARGRIQSDGTYQVGTYKEGDGALPGKYRVSVLPPRPPPSAEKGAARGGNRDAALTFESLRVEFDVTPGPNSLSLTVRRQ
jgi:hypothetical protein